MEALGIPFRDDHKGCKILLTTRSEHVCNLMDCERKIHLKFLTKKESLALIKKIACCGGCFCEGATWCAKGDHDVDLGLEIREPNPKFN